MSRTDLTELPAEEIRRRITSIMQEYDLQMTEISRLCLKAEKIRAELTPLISELSGREGVRDGATD